LGTLLAERLLYIPSIGMKSHICRYSTITIMGRNICYVIVGYCYMATLIWYNVCKFIFYSPIGNDTDNSISDASAEDVDQRDNMSCADDNSDSISSHVDDNTVTKTNSEKSSTDIQTTSKKSNKRKGISPIFFLGVFWIAISVVVAMFSERLMTRNLDWKNDEVLFYSTLDVCPRSAKLHLQLSKITINKKDFINASRHIQLAKEIDPEFCDIGYQEALLHIFYRNDIDSAVEKLVESLHCVFTNTGSWALLSQIWTEQLQKSPNNYNLMEDIGDKAMTAGMCLYIIYSSYIYAIV
jgi:hypothetical protein